MVPKVSLFASAVRPSIWSALLESLKTTTVKWEVMFIGNSDNNYAYCNPIGSNGTLWNCKVGSIKPAQCYEIARRNCTGETVMWIADDCEFPNDVVGKAYNYWKSQNNEKLILSIQTKESGYGQKDGKLFPMKEHTFFSLMPETPLMAPICLMSRKFLEDLGGLDCRYICGQYENDIVMRAYANGATVEIFGDETCYVDIDHLAKSIALGESTDEESFRDRPFAKGYENDRAVLEASWTTFNHVEAFKKLERGERPFSLRSVSKVQLDEFQPYSSNISLEKSESNNLPEMWQ